MQYLLKIGHTWYVRIPVPKDLHQHFPSKEIKKSLKTKNRQQAIALLSSHLATYQQQFFKLRYAPPMEQRPPTLEALAIFERQYPDKSPKPKYFKGVFGVIKPFWPVELMHIMDMLEMGYLPNEHGEFVLSEQPRTFRTVADAPAVPPPASTVPMTTPATAEAPTLNDLIKAYLYEKEHGTKKLKALRPGTLSGYKRVLNKFSVFCRNCDIDTAANRIDKFTDAILDRGVNKNSMNTEAGYINAFYKWCRAKQYTAVTPTITRGTFTPQEKASKGNKVYESEEIQKIINRFAATNTTELDERRNILSTIYYCLTLMFSGFRKEEAITLDKSDIKTIAKVVVIDLSIEKISNLKTLNSPRILPIHKKLKDLYLLEYIEKIEGNRIFHLTYSMYRFRLNSILYELGIKKKAGEKLFHSFRHYFDTALNATPNVQDSHRKMLLGHARDGMDGVYLHIVREQVPEFNKAVQQMAFKFDFEPLRIFLRRELDELY